MEFQAFCLPPKNNGGLVTDWHEGAYFLQCGTQGNFYLSRAFWPKRVIKCVKLKVNPKYVKQLEENGMLFVGKDVEGERMEIMELKGMCLGFTQAMENLETIFPGLGNH